MSSQTNQFVGKPFGPKHIKKPTSLNKRGRSPGKKDVATTRTKRYMKYPSKDVNQVKNVEPSSNNRNANIPNFSPTSPSYSPNFSPNSPSYSPPATANFGNIPSQQQQQPQPPQLPGVMDSQFRVIRKLGQGSYGKVYLVEAKETDNSEKESPKYAIKLSSYQSDGSFGIPSDTLIELSVLGRSDHPNIVKMHQVAYDQQKMVIGIRLTWFNHDLHQFLIEFQGRRSKSDFKPLLFSIVYQIVCGLNYLHSNDIAHLDIKLINILIDENTGHVAIADFGFSERNREGRRYKTKNVATVDFRAPEIQCLTGKYGTPADVWSLGIMMCLMFFNRNPMIIGAAKHKTTAEIERDLFPNMEQSLGRPSQKFIDEYKPDPKWCPLEESLEEHKNENINSFSINPKLREALVPSGSKQDDFTHKELETILDFISRCLRYVPEDRMTMSEALTHPLFDLDRSHCLCQDCQQTKLTPIPEPSDRSQQLDLFDTGACYVMLKDFPIELTWFSSEIYRRYLSTQEGKFNESKTWDDYDKMLYQLASISIAGKLLNYKHDSKFDYRIRLLAKIYHLSAKDFIEGEYTIADKLNWNFDGNWPNEKYTTQTQISRESKTNIPTNRRNRQSRNRRRSVR